MALADEIEKLKLLKKEMSVEKIVAQEKRDYSHELVEQVFLGVNRCSRRAIANKFMQHIQNYVNANPDCELVLVESVDGLTVTVADTLTKESVAALTLVIDGS